MLVLSDVALRRGAHVLFEHASVQIYAGQKVGLTGANGTGKSSLFAAILGSLDTDAGQVDRPAGWVVAHVAQETPATTVTAIDYVLDGDAELRALEAEIERTHAADAGTALAHAYARLESIGGYSARARAAQLLAGLGFAPGDGERPVSEFSGGWRMRLNLAQALMCRSDLLLLDEPTNHLDLDAVLWLETWLRQYPGALLLISHDRDFLDRVVASILHIEQGGVRLYTGNYSEFERQRAERLAGQQAQFEKQQREIAHMHSFVERFRAKATKARQAQSRLKALERMEIIAPAHVDSPFHFEFFAPDKLPRPLLRLREANAGYAEKPVLKSVDLAIYPGDRIGLLGLNGAGKSTLIKLLAGAIAPLAGARDGAPALNVGYFAQHQLEQLRADRSPVEHLAALDPREREHVFRSFLGGFGFTNEKAIAPVGPFSGGEKARLVLALLVYQRPNLLLLDEPTNHLDLDMREALVIALQGFDGALVVVSHDRHLLRTTTDTLLLVDSGQVGEFDGDLDDYPAWLAARGRGGFTPAATKPETPAANIAADRKTQRRDAAEERKRLQPFRRSVERAERKLDEVAKRRKALEAELADAGIYNDANKERLKALLVEQAYVDRDHEAAETAWMEASEALEAAEAG
ncbi:MAG: ATP-binding cassette domain-containing protein [Chromatiales bacterium]|nr:ATP-binding cassette domain-containing protein [Chromatiales bacterium]